jgi:hypothetical protein
MSKRRQWKRCLDCRKFYPSEATVCEECGTKLISTIWTPADMKAREANPPKPERRTEETVWFWGRPMKASTYRRIMKKDADFQKTMWILFLIGIVIAILSR